jgi:hypothetical protein
MMSVLMDLVIKYLIDNKFLMVSHGLERLGNEVVMK